MQPTNRLAAIAWLTTARNSRPELTTFKISWHSPFENNRVRWNSHLWLIIYIQALATLQNNRNRKSKKKDENRMNMRGEERNKRNHALRLTILSKFPPDSSSALQRGHRGCKEKEKSKKKIRNKWKIRKKRELPNCSKIAVGEKNEKLVSNNSKRTKGKEEGRTLI